MENNVSDQASPPAQNSPEVGAVTYAMVRMRAAEVATSNGHSAQNVSKADWEQARRDLAGEPEAGTPPALPGAGLPVVERSDMPDAGGHQVPDAPVEGEDEDGRNESAQLVEEGAAGDGRALTLPVPRAPRKTDRLES